MNQIVHATDPVIEQIVHRLVAALAPERIYISGSHARGDAGPDSDYDVLVVLPTSKLPRYRRDQAAYGALLGIGIAKDVLVLTHDVI